MREGNKTVQVSGLNSWAHSDVISQEDSVWSRSRLGLGCEFEMQVGGVWVEDTHLRVSSISMVFKTVKSCK